MYLYQLILRLGRLDLRAVFTGSLPTTCRDAGSAKLPFLGQVCIIPYLAGMFNKNLTFLRKKFARYWILDSGCSIFDARAKNGVFLGTKRHKIGKK